MRHELTEDAADVDICRAREAGRPKDRPYGGDGPAFSAAGLKTRRARFGREGIVFTLCVKCQDHKGPDLQLTQR